MESADASHRGELRPWAAVHALTTGQPPQPELDEDARYGVQAGR